jgi:hypothetical protein
LSNPCRRSADGANACWRRCREAPTQIGQSTIACEASDTFPGKAVTYTASMGRIPAAPGNVGSSQAREAEIAMIAIHGSVGKERSQASTGTMLPKEAFSGS